MLNQNTALVDGQANAALWCVAWGERGRGKGSARLVLRADRVCFSRAAHLLPSRLIFFIACNFFVYLLLISLLIALVTNVFMQHMKDPRSRWHLERARASLMIEASLTNWQRLSLPLQHRYFIWLRPASWAVKGEVELPPRPYLFAQENDLVEVRRAAEKRKAGALKSFVSVSTRKLLDIEEEEE